MSFYALSLNTKDLVSKCDKWVDENTALPYKLNETLALWGRVGKLGEEYGEVIEALIGITGQNPRKGITHTTDDLLNELADVWLTALCAIQHILKDTNKVDTLLYTHMRKVVRRIDDEC